MQVILYNYENNVAVMSVAPNMSLTILEIGKKDVPYGLPFWIADVAELPLDQPTESWVVNEETMGAPDGYGERGGPATGNGGE